MIIRHLFLSGDMVINKSIHKFISLFRNRLRVLVVNLDAWFGLTGQFLGILLKSPSIVRMHFGKRSPPSREIRKTLCKQLKD